MKNKIQGNEIIYGILFALAVMIFLYISILTIYAILFLDIFGSISESGDISLTSGQVLFSKFGIPVIAIFEIGYIFHFVYKHKGFHYKYPIYLIFINLILLLLIYGLF